MNPPFAKQADIAHVRHAHTFLATNGLLVSIMGASVAFREDKRTVEFRAWVAEHGGAIEALPDGSFKSSGTGVRTGSRHGACVSATATPVYVLAGRARWAVVEEDCLATMRAMPDASVDACPMDPPYGVDIAEWDGDLPPQTWLDECLRIRVGRCSGSGPAPKVLEFANYKPPPRQNHGMGACVLPRADVSTRHSLLSLASHCSLETRSEQGGAVPFDVLRHNTHGRNEWNHNCTKPLKLMRDLVLAFSPPDGGTD